MATELTKRQKALIKWLIIDGDALSTKEIPPHYHRATKKEANAIMSLGFKLQSDMDGPRAGEGPQIWYEDTHYAKENLDLYNRLLVEKE